MLLNVSKWRGGILLGFLIVGISFGLSAGFSPGPLFAMVISQTIKYGLKEGVKAAFSPLITDLPIIAVTTLLLNSLYAYKPLLGIISLSGGLFVAYLAYENMKTGPVPEDLAADAPDSIMKGALVNALSPHPYLFWITVGSPLLIEAYLQGVLHAAAFVVSFYICLIGAKVLLAVLVNKSRDFLQGKAYIYTMRILGVLLLVFAGYLFKDGVKLLLN
jgi:threonine/homoserine/homoserine lactone efflux protein